MFPAAERQLVRPPTLFTTETKRVLLKVAVAVLLVVAGVLFGAGFGAFHDQISFTAAPEYYTRFKFIQFAWAGVADMTPRVGAAVVGILATWWVGLAAGVMLSLVALIHHSPFEMLRNGLKAYGVLAGVALAAGLFGLAYGWAEGRDAAALSTWLPSGLESPRRFWAVGAMHNASYLGGALGMLVAIGFHVRARRVAIRAIRASRVNSRGAAV